MKLLSRLHVGAYSKTLLARVNLQITPGTALAWHDIGQDGFLGFEGFRGSF